MRHLITDTAGLLREYAKAADRHATMVARMYLQALRESGLEAFGCAVASVWAMTEAKLYAERAEKLDPDSEHTRHAWNAVAFASAMTEATIRLTKREQEAA